MTSNDAAAKSDVYSYWDMLAVWIMLAIVIVGAEFDPSPLLLLPVLLASLLWFTTALTRIVLNAFRRRWRRVLCIVAAPLSAGLLVWGWHCSGISPDEVRLKLWRSSYLAELADHQVGQGRIQIRIWPWRHWTGGLAGTPDFFDLLVYDSSDQIAVPRNKRTANWYESADAAGFGKSIIVHPELVIDPEAFDRCAHVTHLGGHFYVFFVSL